jgi:serine/threonine protein phosphatase 1
MMWRCEDRSVDWLKFLWNGGTQTLASYEGHEDEFENDRRWMASLPTSYEDELRIFVHAGIKPNQPLADQTDDTKMWTRDEFINFQDAFPKYVVHGHTPTFRRYSSDPGSPDVRENRCNLDTGACYGGALSAAFFNHAEAKPFHTISVT